MDREGYMSVLRSLRDEWSDEIPEEVFDSRSGKKFKVRKAWFGGVYNVITAGIKMGFVDETSRELYDDFRRLANETGFRDRLTTREDINRANSIIDSVMSYLAGDRQPQI